MRARSRERSASCREVVGLAEKSASVLSCPEGNILPQHMPGEQLASNAIGSPTQQRIMPGGGCQCVP
jgi:hypothetical protein